MNNLQAQDFSRFGKHHKKMGSMAKGNKNKGIIYIKSIWKELWGFSSYDLIHYINYLTMEWRLKLMVFFRKIKVFKDTRQDDKRIFCYRLKDSNRMLSKWIWVESFCRVYIKVISLKKWISTSVLNVVLSGVSIIYLLGGLFVLFFDVHV